MFSIPWPSTIFSYLDSSDTFRPQKQHPQTSRRYELHLRARQTLGTSDLREAVRLPEGENRQEWLALKTIDCFNEANVVFCMIADECTASCCPRMSAGERYTYNWADPTSTMYKRPTPVAARKYVELLMEWIGRLVDDGQIFPTEPDKLFPADFESSVVTNIFRRLFRVYAHIYYSHMERVQALQMEPHLNTTFKHFVYCALEFDLIPEKEREPLAEKIDLLQREDEARHRPRSSWPHQQRPTCYPAKPTEEEGKVGAKPLSPISAIAAGMLAEPQHQILAS